MEKNTIVYILILTTIISFTFSCMPEEDLPVKDMGLPPPYFIECYCRPDITIGLLATTIIPVSKELAVNFCTDLDITVTASMEIPLKQIMFSMPGSNFVYNYRSDHKLNVWGVDSLSLDVTTPDGKKISASTIIPSQVSIDSMDINSNCTTIFFRTAHRPEENYYIYALSTFRQDSMLNTESIYLDFSSYKSYSDVEHSIHINLLNNADKAIISLKRITKECYDYLLSLNSANSAQHGSITTPTPLAGNINGAIGIFTCYTEDSHIIQTESIKH